MLGGYDDPPTRTTANPEDATGPPRDVRVAAAERVGVAVRLGVALTVAEVDGAAPTDRVAVWVEDGLLLGVGVLQSKGGATALGLEDNIQGITSSSLR